MGQGQFSEGKAAWHSSHPYGQTLPSSKAGWHGACWKISLLNPQARPDIVWERGGWSGPSPCLGSWCGFSGRDDPRGGFSLVSLRWLVCLLWPWGALGLHIQIVPARTQHLGSMARPNSGGPWNLALWITLPQSPSPGINFLVQTDPPHLDTSSMCPPPCPQFPRKNLMNRPSCILQDAEGESCLMWAGFVRTLSHPNPQRNDRHKYCKIGGVRKSYNGLGWKGH